MKKLVTGFLCVASLSAGAEMTEMADDQLESTTAQAGITLSARVELDSGSRFSYTNADADYADNQEYWLVIDEVTGAIEMKGLQIDLVNDFGPSGNAGAIQWTMPDEVVFDEFRTDGVYMSTEKVVNAESRFLLGVEVDGTLQFPANTTMSIFATQ